MDGSALHQLMLESGEQNSFMDIKRLDATINDKKKKYIDKVGALLAVLGNVLSDYLSQTSPEQTLLLFEFLHRHTLNLVLHGDWGKHVQAKNTLKFSFIRFEEVAIKRNITTIKAKIKTLLDLIPDPWGNATLTKILNDEPYTNEEALTFIKVEMGVVLIVRLEIMVEARLDVQALRLIEACLKVVDNTDNTPYFEEYIDEIVYIRDIYFILLVRTKSKVKVCKKVGELGLTKTLELVQRCVRVDRTARLKKSRVKMADFVANIALILAMMEPITEENVLFDLMEEWINLFTDTQTVFCVLGTLVRYAVSSQHIYLLGLLIVKKFGETEKSQCIELYIRALTVNLNEVQKHKSNCDQESLKESEVQLSHGFLLLADYLKEDLITCRECVLTAFSLNPTKICYDKLKDLAIASGKLRLQEEHGPEDNCENNQSSINCEKRSFDNQGMSLKIDTGQLTGSEELLRIQVGGDMKEKQSDNDSTANLEFESENQCKSMYNFQVSLIHISDAQKIGIPQTLCDDLATVISSARYQVLNWNLDWSELSKRCESYIISGKEVRSTEKELKYLNIDYNQFKDWPNKKEFNTGIEKGFEQCLNSESDEECSNSKVPSNDEHAEYITDTSTNISLSVSESDSQTNKTQKVKRKALLPVPSPNSDSEIKHTSVKDLVDKSFVKKLVGKRKSKAVQNEANYSLLPSNQHEPLSLQLSVNHICEESESLDIESIEEDAKKLPSPTRVSSARHYNLKKITIEKNPSYCIVEQDLTSPFSSPSKLSDPSVLKSLRMYRSKKPNLENVCTDGEKEKGLQRFTPILNTIDLNPRILNRPTPKTKSSDVITIDIDSDPEIIDLVDDDSDEECSTTTKSKCNTKLPQIKNKMKWNYEDVLKSPSVNKKSAFSKPSCNSKNDFSFTKGLNSLEMIRPPISETTVQVVQLSNSTCPLVTSNSSSVPSTTMIFTMTQQSGSVSHGLEANNNSSVIYSMAQQAPITVDQVSNTNMDPITTVIHTMPQRTTSLIQGRSTATVTSESFSKPITSSNSSLSNRASNVSLSQTNTLGNMAADLSDGTSARNMFNSNSRQVFSQAQGYSSRLSPEHALYNPPMNVTSPIRTPSPHDLVMGNPTLGVIRVERYLYPSSEANTSMPNLSPIKSTVSTKSQTINSNRHMYMRNSVTKTSAITQTQSVVTSSSRQSSLSTSSSVSANSRSMPVTAHIQRVGFPPESSHTLSNMQMKYLIKEGSFSTCDEKQHSDENESETPNVSIVLSTEQIQQLLPKSLGLKNASEQDDNNSSQGASLPKFQQAFGKTKYQNTSTTSNNVSLPTSNEQSQINFAQQMQVSNVSVDTSTSASMCTVLSKAVQTSKENQMIGKTRSHNSNDHSQHLKSSSGNSVQAVNVSTSTTQDEMSSDFTNSAKSRTSDRTSILSQTPVKIFCKVPVTLANTNLIQGKSVAILKTSVSSDKMSQTQIKYEVDNNAKDTVIRSNMSALLAAALQAQPHLITPSNSSSTTSSQGNLKSSPELEKKKSDQFQSSSKSSSKNFRKTPVVHQPVARYTKPVAEVSISGNNQCTVSSASVMTIPIRTVLTTAQQTSRLDTDRVDVRSEALGNSSGQDDSSGSSLLDQQLKEFESVFNKVKKSSQMKERTNCSTPQNQPHLNINQQILLTQPSSTSSTVEILNTSTNQTTLFQTTSTSTIHDLQTERVSLTFISQPTPGATNTIIAGTNKKITATPVVVVQSCSNPVASPALSVTSQGSLSPVPSIPGSSSGKITSTTIVKQQNKPNKSKTAPTKTIPTTTIKISTLPKPQQKPQEDEQTTQRIYAILDKYAEQLRNSPELKNKPAPRRRSNPPTNPSQNSKRKKSSQTKSKTSQQASCSSGLDMSPGSEDMHTLGSEDSSNGVSQLSQSLNSPQSRPDNPSTPTGGDVSSETSESLDSRDARIQSRLVLTDTTPTGQSRTVIVQDNVPNQVLNVDASKLLTGKPVVVGSQTIVPQLVLPNVPGVQKMQLFPVQPDGRQLVVTKVPKMYRVHQVTVPRGAATVPLIASSNSTVVFKPMCGTSPVKQVKLPGGSNVSTQSMSGVMPSGPHSFTLSHDSADAININLDNALLLNSTSPQSISFVRHSIPTSSYQNQDNSHHGSTITTVTSPNSSHKTTVTYSTSDSNVSYLKQESGNTLSACSSINVTPESSSQDTKPVSCINNSSNLPCITLNDDNGYSTGDKSSVGSQVSTVVSHTSSNNKRWRSAEATTTQTPESIKKDNASEEFSFQPTAKSMGQITTPSSSVLMCKQDRFSDTKKCSKKKSQIDKKQDLQIKEEEKPERVLQEPDLCEGESVSSDSASSGRVKTKSEEKPKLVTETSQDTASPWRFNVTKIDCIAKSESSSTSIKQNKPESGSLTVTQSRESSYKKKTDNANYQTTFKKSDRSKASSKENERNVLDRDIRLQKSLSEDCEDLGVDEPSTSDLFPEAELILDPDHSSRESQLDLPSEMVSQTVNSSASCDSRRISPMVLLGKRPATCRSGIKSQATNKVSRFVPIYNPSYQFPEDNTNAKLSSTKGESPECRIVSSKLRGKKSEANSGGSSCIKKPQNVKDNQNPIVKLKKQISIHDRNKSSSSGTITPLNGGESKKSSKTDQIPISSISKEALRPPKKSKDSKNIKVETSDFESNTETINLISSDDTSHEKSAFIPIPNPAATAPFTYAGNRSNRKFSSKKIQSKRELWKSLFKDDSDSDMSDQDHVRLSNKKNTSTDEEQQQSEGETRAKNGLTAQKELVGKGNDKIVGPLKPSRKRSGSLLKCSSSKTKMHRKTEPQHIEELLPELHSSATCPNASRHHHISSRRSSLRGHVKKNCPCCNGLQETPNSPVKVSPKPEKLLSNCPSPVLSVGSSKKKQSRSILKSSHITKKR